MIFIEDKFVTINLKLAILALALKDVKKNHFMAFIKNASLIKKLVNKSLNLFFNNKTIAKM